VEFVMCDGDERVFAGGAAWHVTILWLQRLCAHHVSVRGIELLACVHVSATSVLARPALLQTTAM